MMYVDKYNYLCKPITKGERFGFFLKIDEENMLCIGIQIAQLLLRDPLFGDITKLF